MSNQKDVREEFKIDGEKVLEKVKQLIKDGNVRSITIKNEEGNTLFTIPLTWGIVGTVCAPVLAAVGALAAVIGKCIISIEKSDSKSEK